jgi:short-subunit dehydrogenase
MDASRRTALITGASSGIGEDLARLFARDGYDLVLVARRAERLEALGAELAGRHGIRATAIAEDLADPDAPARLVARLDAGGVEVSALVNNAAFGLLGPFAANDWDVELRMMQLNVVALVELTKRLLPGMLARGEGRILNVASTAAFQPGPRMAVYYATKAFVLSFSEAVRGELAGSGVTVTTLCPGPTATEFADAAEMKGARLFRLGRVMRSADVAAIGYDGMQRGKGVVVAGLMNGIVARLVPFVPRNVVNGVIARLHESATA